MKDLNKEIRNTNRELTNVLAQISISLFKRKERKQELAYVTDDATLCILQKMLGELKAIEEIYKVSFTGEEE